MKALFVCTGNLCRSVMAEYLLNHQAQKLKLDGWQARSCGTAAQPYLQVPLETHKVLADYGINHFHHRATLVNPALIDWADIVLAMSSNHLEALHSLYPASHQKLRLFLESAGIGKKDVADPMGQALEVYAKCCSLIEKGIRGFIEKNANLTEKPRS